MTNYKRRNSGSWKPDWDRGNGWARTKDEWQDYEKSVTKTIDVADLKDMWCPASGSTISIRTEVEGLEFDLVVQAKEYHKDSGRKRKPTQFGVTFKGDGRTIYYPFIPLPNANPQLLHTNAWHSKQSWSAAVRELLNSIIPAYVNQSETMCLRAVVQQQCERGMPQLSQSGEEEASAA